MITLVDAADYDRLARHRWCARRNGALVYAQRNSSSRIPRTTIQMHREILGAEPGDMVDHINGDSLDNRRANLRIVTPSQNAINKRVRADSATGIKGVRRVASGRFGVRLYLTGGRPLHLGTFDTLEEAAAVRRAAALAHFGDYARKDMP